MTVEFMKDQFDKDIIRLLQSNARASYAEISRAINLSPSAVADRIQRLEDLEYISGYKVQVNYEKMGFPIQAYITIRFEGRNCARFKENLKNFPEIVECHGVTGQDCMFIRVVARNNAHLESLIDRLYSYGQTCTSIILSDVLSQQNIAHNIISQ